MVPTINAQELADWLCYASTAAFQNAAPRLIAEHGFPRKLPGRPIWSRKAVLQWIERQGGVEPAVSRATAPVLDIGEDEFETIRKGLEARYVGAA